MTINILVGELLTGRITDTLPAGDVLSANWTDGLNANGSVDSVTVPEAVVRDLNLRQRTHEWRCFLAFERDGRIKQAGPIVTRGWDWERGAATLGAQGMWAYFDKRVARSATVTPPYQSKTLTIAGKSLGGIARGLVAENMAETYGAVPVVLPADEAGDHTESFQMWKLLYTGEQLRQLTQRATDAPDIRFQPRRRADDPRFLEWVMEVGTVDRPALVQAGPDWVFDTSAPRSPVLGIATDSAGTEMATEVWATGNGSEEAILMAQAESAELTALGWPLLENDEAHSTVEEQATLEGHADAFLGRVNRPIEVYKVKVRAEAVAEVKAGDYAQIITKGDAWLADTDRTVRIRQVSGSLDDSVDLEMFSVQADL